MITFYLFGAILLYMILASILFNRIKWYEYLTISGFSLLSWIGIIIIIIIIIIEEYLIWKKERKDRQLYNNLNNK